MPPAASKPADDAALIAAAEKALGQAYARYSGFRVGAALLTANGNVFAGCNVESVAYPLGQCAERNAISAAVLGEGPEMRVVRLALVASFRGAPAPCTPCGACRQVILEWGKDATVLCRDADGRITRSSALDLLPKSFGFSPEPSK